MQRELIVKGSSLGGSADLTLLAPIRSGMVDALDSVSHKTRIKRVLGLLHAARKGAHEHAAARLLSDAVERVGVILSVRVAVLEPEDKVLLAVSFDGPWEAYIRVLWDKVGTLLDLIFCGTEGYVVAWDHGFDAWLGWARRVQVESDFYYGPPATAVDLLYLRRVQLMREHAAPAARLDLLELRAVMPGAEQAVDRLVEQADRVGDDPPVDKIDTFQMARQRVRQGVQALGLLYRLVDLFPPGTDDAPVLRRAAIELLREFVQLRNQRAIDDQLAEQRARFARALDWLFPDANPVRLQRLRPPLPEPYAVPPEVRADAQGGILRGYEGITHGAVLLLGLDGPAAARALLDAVLPLLTRDAQSHDAAGTVFRNLAFTAAGLRALGLDEDTLELFPEAFRQGMAARAGLLGDVRHNHPRRWRLPRRFGGIDAAPGDDVVDLTAVHAVLQLRCEARGAAALAALELADAAHPLRTEVAAWAALAPGVRLLSVQAMRRRYRPRNGRDAVVEHFGYADGEGQPEIESAGGGPLANRVRLGELLWGHANSADPAPGAADPARPWLVNGSFLVLRKYRQFVERLHAAVLATAAQMQQRLGGELAGHVETVYAKLMGRRRDGMPLLPTEPGRPNDFDYRDDAQGQRCPMRAHIRRAHPRTAPEGSDRAPRLMRRGMSYGPPAEAGAADRGLVFMAYAQSLSEQFEVVQRWLTGGNSTGIASAASCPLLGVPDNGVPRIFRFELPDAAGQAQVFQVQLEARRALFEDPAVPIQLEWGLYLFAPGMAALCRLRAAADAAAGASAAPVAWQVEHGLKLLQRLQALEPAEHDPPPVRQAKAEAARQGWKTAVEDPGAIDRLHAASIWAALRAHHGGLLKTSYGTLVADRALLAEVLLDTHKRYSVCGQRERMQQGFGDIYLGLDAGADYDAQSARMNQAIGALGFGAVFEAARDAATRKIDAVVAEAQQQACDFGDARYDTVLDARELMDHVLGDLCEDWFGVDDQPPGARRLARGSTDWAWHEDQPPLYPGHFTALSRHMFQPHPGQVPRDLGPRYGRALRPALRGWVEWHVDQGTLPRAPRSAHGAAPAPLAEAAFAYLKQGYDADFVARLVVGVMMGFIPTLIGAVLNVLLEWRRDGCFETLRSALQGRRDAAAACDLLAPAMRRAARMRPMPQLTWRTVLAPHVLKDRDGREVALAAGDTVVLAIVSGTQQSLADGQPDPQLMFGGARAAAPHPTHACPGYEAGIATLLGCLSALLGRAEDLREGPAALSYAIEGPTRCAPLPPPVPMAEAAVVVEYAARRIELWTEVPQPGTRQGLVLAWGDSWLAYELGLSAGMDLRDWLEGFGYRAPKDFCSWARWGKLHTMAEGRAEFAAALEASISSTGRPRAVLLSGGGNDSTGDALRALINPKGASAQVLDAGRVAAHVAQLRAHYLQLLSAIGAALKNKQAESLVPVLVHGYDHPIPAGQGLPIKQRWLYRPFVDAGYTLPDGTIDLPLAAQAMRELIDALNTMLIGLQQSFAFVRHVDLRGTIALHHPGRPVAGWHDDLHPQDDMFKLMAAKLDAAID